MNSPPLDLTVTLLQEWGDWDQHPGLEDGTLYKPFFVGRNVLAYIGRSVGSKKFEYYAVIIVPGKSYGYHGCNSQEKAEEFIRDAIAVWISDLLVLNGDLLYGEEESVTLQ